VEDVLVDVGTEVAARAWRASDLTGEALRALAPLAALLTHPVSALDAGAVGLRLTTGQQSVLTSVRHRLLFDTGTFSTFLVYWGDAAGAPLDVSLTLPVEGVPGLRDLLTGARPAVTGYRRDATTRRIDVSVPLTGRPMLVDFNEGATDVMVERSEVSAATTLSVAEIISRHQQAQLTQDVLVRQYAASARWRQHFRPTVTDAGYDVVTENRYFVEGPTVEWEELSFSVNGSKWGADRPPFPLLQPEKVLSLPLQLRFDEGYTYRLDGVDRVDGFDCYVVRFEPVRKDSSLYRGTVWIDRRTFARIRVHAVQGGLSAPVVSNEETHRYSLATTIDNQPVFLFSGLSARQIVLVAGRNLLVEKEVTFSDFRVNDETFEAARAAARVSNRIMFRETDAGLRYFLKEGDTRVVSDTQTTRAKALAMGTYIDASYSFLCRSSASTTSTSVSAGRRTPNWPCCSAVCSRPGTFNGRSSARRSSMPASTFSPSRCRPAIGSTNRAAKSRPRVCSHGLYRLASISAGRRRRFRSSRFSISCASTSILATGRPPRRSSRRRAR
jgi:hypothetical protein